MRRDGRGRRQEMVHEDVNADTAMHATTLTLLRSRARSLRGLYAKMWRCVSGNPKDVFVYVSPEVGDKTEGENMLLLQDYIDAHVRRGVDLRRQIDGSYRIKEEWMRSNRSGGAQARFFRERDRAVLEELTRRDVRAEAAALADPTPTIARAVNREPVYPASYVDQLERQVRDRRVRDLGISKPSVLDKVMADRTRAFQRGDLDVVERLDAQMERKREKNRRDRQLRKARKRDFREEENARRERNDPPSEFGDDRR